jgi:hypothetical protein
LDRFSLPDLPDLSFPAFDDLLFFCFVGFMEGDVVGLSVLNAVGESVVVVGLE